MSQGSTDSERHSVISNSSQPADKSEEFKRIISENLLPIIHDIFKTYVDDPSNFLKPTDYLNTKLKENNPDNWQNIQNDLIINAIKNYDKFEKSQIINIQVDKKLF